MDKKKILIVSRSFHPGTWPRAHRATELAVEFARQGHDVTVLVPNEDLEERREFARTNRFKIKFYPSYRQIRNTNKKSNLSHLIGRYTNRITNWLFEYPNIMLVPLVSKALQTENNFDLLISIAHPYPIHWGVSLALKRNHNIARKWVADCGDPYIHNKSALLSPPFYFRLLDNWFLSKTDFVTIPIKEALSSYNSKYHKKFRVIPQGFNFNKIKVYNGNLSQNKIIFGYAGMFIPKFRDPSEFLSYLNSLDENKKFEFHIFTYNESLVKPFVDNSRGRIIMRGILPRAELLYELSKMHFLVNFENQSTSYLPSKLIDYAFLNKPILSVKYGKLNKNIVDQFLNGDYTNQFVVDNLEQYKIENVTKKFLDLLNE